MLEVGHKVSRSDEQGRLDRLRAAAKFGICSACGRTVQPDETIYWVKTRAVWGRWKTVCCSECVSEVYRCAPSRPCLTCRRPVVERTRSSRAFCCQRCRWTFYNRRQARRREAARRKRCAACGVSFGAARSDAKTCSPKCRTRLYRSRKSSQPIPSRSKSRRPAA